MIGAGHNLPSRRVLATVEIVREKDGMIYMSPVGEPARHVAASSAERLCIVAGDFLKRVLDAQGPAR